MTPMPPRHDSRLLTRLLSCILLWAALTATLLNTLFLSYFHQGLDKAHRLILARLSDPDLVLASARPANALFHMRHDTDSLHGHRPPPPTRDDWIASRYRGALEVTTMDSAARHAVAKVRPFKSEEERLRTSRCFRARRGYGQLAYGFLLQMQDAFGRSLQRYLSAICMENPGQIIYLSEGHTFNTSCFHHQGELLALTHLRHPILRIISLYWNHARADNKARRGSMAGGGGRGGTVIAFDDYINRSRASDGKHRRAYHARYVTGPVDNYYIKVLTNRYRHPQAPVTRRDLYLAKRILASFDMVLIAEWMAHDNQTTYINALLGEERAGRRLLRLRAVVGQVEGDNSLISQEAIEALEESNRLDLELFDFAKELVALRMQDFYSNTSAYLPPLSVAEEGECRAPLNPPRWHSSGNYSLVTPIAGTYLFTPPFCVKA